MKTIERRIEDWRLQLLDLTKRNPLLSFRVSTTRPTSIQLTEPDAETIFQSLLAGNQLELAAETDDPGDFADDLVPESDAPLPPEDALPAELPPLLPGQVRSSLKAERTYKVGLRLATRARGSEQEQGVTTLFVAFGLLRWQLPNETDWLSAPLVLLPARIVEHRRKESWVISAVGDDPEFNQTLAENLRQTLGLDLAPEIGEEPRLGRILAAVADAVRERPGWEVRPEVHLAIFQFHKLRMFADLGEYAATAANHPIVLALGTDGAVVGGLPEGMPAMEDLDRAVAPADMFTVLDADAAQLHAIAAVKRGGNVIVMGPPGTGKSQTISNIIAEAMAAGKTVLFVSEKAAAIQVVHRRLVAAGLGDLCLMLHSLSAGKRDVIAELGRRLDDLAAQPRNPDTRPLDELGDVRARLAEYTALLHQPRLPLGMSVYEVYGALAAVGDVPLVRTSLPDSGEVTEQRLRREADIVAAAARHAPVLAQGEAHVWAGINASSVNFATRGELQSAVQSAGARLERVRSAGESLAAELGLPEPARLPDLERLAALAAAAQRARGVPADWLSRDAVDRKTALCREARERTIRLNEFRLGVGAAFDEAPDDLDVAAALSLYEKPAFIRFFLPGWWALRSRLAEAGGADWMGDSIRAAGNLRALAGLRENEAWFAARQADLSREFAWPAGSGDVAFWDAASQKLDLAREVADALPAGGAPAGLARWLGGQTVTTDPRPAEIARTLPDLRADLGVIERFHQPGRAAAAGGALPDAPLRDLARWLGERERRFDDLDAWVQADQTRADIRETGLQPLVAELIESGAPGTAWANMLRRRRLTDWLGAMLAGEPALARFAGSDHQHLVERFRELDDRSVRLGAPRVLASVAGRTAVIGASGAGEPAILRHEARKTRRHMPLRRLFALIPGLLPALKPCIMMSPLTVAQYLPADRYAFDLVIFDEASQVRPHDAIGAIMRGRQLVVAGDSKQLPPTAFFDRAIGDGEPEQESQQDIRELESILDALETREMPVAPLLWHYRSRHESLIAWSNVHIYGGKLITTPAARVSADHGHGVRFEYVQDGVYEQMRDRALGASVRVNRAEGDRVVELVRRHVREHPGRSLGVVAFGSNQRDLIIERLKDARELDAVVDEFCRDEGAEPFFIKALEEVQGDERDTMIVSVGFGRNREGVLSHNFGPINHDGGERRLNVLMTRAREQLILVASIRAGDIDERKVSKSGPKLLKNYLDYAEHGPVALEQLITSVGDEAESPFEEAVAAALERRGWTVHRQIGVSKYRIDLGVVDPDQPGRYLLAVECDGATYHSLKTARDRDRLRQDVLEGLGWEFHRVWSTEWMRSQDRELARIEDRLARIRAGERTVRAMPEPLPDLPPLRRESDEAEPMPRPMAAREVPPEGQPYRVAEVPVTTHGNLLDASLSALVKAVVAVVEVEGPIHRDLLIRRISAAWGHARAGRRITDELSLAIEEAMRKGSIRRAGLFLRPALGTDPVPRGQAADGWVREIGHVAPEERVAAMVAVLVGAISLPEDELVQRTARLLGYSRTGSEIDRELRATVKAQLGTGVLELVAGRIRAVR